MSGLIEASFQDLLSLDPAARTATATESRAVGLPVVVGDLGGLDKRLMSRGIKKRRTVPIMGYLGTSGHGKSGSLVRDTLLTLAEGRPVLSTLEFLDEHTGNAHPLFTRFESFRQLEAFREGDCVMDEISGIMDSHDAAMPKYVRRLLPQCRRRKISIRWSGIDWDNSNRRLRQMTQAVTICRGYFPRKGSAGLWKQNRAFLLKTYDAQKMMRSEDAQALNKNIVLVGKQPKVVKPAVLVREWWRGSTSLAFGAYDTMADVSGVDGGCAHIDRHTGKVCGGRIPDTVCRGHDGE